MRLHIGILMCWLILLTLTTHAQTNESERDEIQKAIDKLYTTLSFKDGEWKQAEDLKNLFFADSRFIASFGSTPQVWTTDQYISSVQNNMTKQGISGVEEKEIFEKKRFLWKSCAALEYLSNQNDHKREGDIPHRNQFYSIDQG